MIHTVNGSRYRDLIDYGLRNLMRYSKKVNDLNVFPVPDGDTGTNMVKTLQNGFSVLAGKEGPLSELSRSFAKAVVFGARGNSGVIVSQFFKGFSECFFDTDEADSHVFASALEQGVKCAYRAVSNPVEGTVLTVLRESASFVNGQLRALPEVPTVNETVDLFLKQARITLENTPNLLPILKSAGVVDSGGAGIVYVFEGMRKYLNNEDIAPGPAEEEAAFVDYSKFGRESSFDLGYCTEFLLQQTANKDPVDPDAFKAHLEDLGDSVVTVFEEDKVKVHVHTLHPETILAFAHNYGEFLSLKIENMSVQHSELASPITLYTGPAQGSFAVVTVAHDEGMKDRFLEMGADGVILGSRDCQPSTEDFLKAFEATGATEIFVFPNSKNSSLAARQAGEFSKAKVTVFETKTMAECYAVLSMMNFEAEDKAALEREISQIIENVCAVVISRAAKDSVFDGTAIERNDFVAFAGTTLLSAGKDRIAVAIRAVEGILNDGERDTVTLFVGKNTPAEEVHAVCDYLEKRCPYTDQDRIQTENDTFDLILSFE